MTLDTPVGVMLYLGRGSEFPEAERKGLPPHVTPLYALVSADDARRAGDAFEAAAVDLLPVAMTYGGVTHFDHGDKSVAVYQMVGPQIHALRAKLLGALSDIGVRYELTHGGEFRPHATIGYLAPGERLEAPPMDGDDIASQGQVMVGDTTIDIESRPSMLSDIRHAAMLAEPHGLPTPEGLTAGRWLRVASVGPIHDRYSSEEIINITPGLLRALAEYVTAQSHDAPVVIDSGHDESSRGQVLAARYVEDERGPGLEVAPAYNARGLAEIDAHGGVLWTSIDIAPGGFSKTSGERVAGAVLRFVSLTTAPRSPASGLDRVRLGEIPTEAGPEPVEADAMEIEELRAELKAAQDKNAELTAQIEGMKPAEDVEAAEAAAETVGAELAETRGENARLSEQLQAQSVRLGELEFRAALSAAHARGHTALSETRARTAWDAKQAGHAMAWDMLTGGTVTPGGKQLGEEIGHSRTVEPPAAKSVTERMVALAESEGITRAEAFSRIKKEMAS